MPARLVVERLDTLEVTYKKQFTLKFVDTLKEVSGIFRLRSSAIPVYGDYQAMLFVDDEVIGQKKFSNIPKESKP